MVKRNHFSAETPTRVPEGGAVADCRWFLYGCTYKPTLANSNDHNSKCDIGKKIRDHDARKLWEELMEFHLSNPETINPLKGLRAHAKSLKLVSHALPSGPCTSMLQWPCTFDVHWPESGKPTPEDVWGGIKADINKRFDKDEIDKFLSQMDDSEPHEADPDEIQKLLNGVASAKFNKKFPITIPWIPDRANAFVVDASWNGTPKFSFVDTHIDRGMDSASYAVGGVKTWIIWMPRGYAGVRGYTLDDFEDVFFDRWADGNGLEKVKGSTIFETLPECDAYIAQTKDNVGLYIPHGWKHAVFTLESGFLAGIVFAGPDCLPDMLTVFERECRATGTETRRVGKKRMSPIHMDDVLSSLGGILSALEIALEDPKMDVNYGTYFERITKVLVDYPTARSKSHDDLKRIGKMVDSWRQDEHLWRTY